VAPSGVAWRHAAWRATHREPGHEPRAPQVDLDPSLRRLDTVANHGIVHGEVADRFSWHSAGGAWRPERGVGEWRWSGVVGVVGGRQWGVPACEESAGRVRVRFGVGGVLLPLLVTAGPAHPRWSRLALIGSWSVPTPRTATTRSAQASGRPGVEPVPWPTREGAKTGLQLQCPNGGRRTERGPLRKVPPTLPPSFLLRLYHALT
jgi:hypothetical protein